MEKKDSLKKQKATENLLDMLLVQEIFGMQKNWIRNKDTSEIKKMWWGYLMVYD